ncbi:hypothetical protein ASE46_10370 [Bacillus sp. Root239]|nr:hypothetical protein ASE46_10370 [Bacillus sp. Root239]
MNFCVKKQADEVFHQQRISKKSASYQASKLFKELCNIFFLKKYVIFFTYLLKKDKHVCIIRIVKDM